MLLNILSTLIHESLYFQKIGFNSATFKNLSQKGMVLDFSMQFGANETSQNYVHNISVFLFIYRCFRGLKIWIERTNV